MFLRFKLKEFASKNVKFQNVKQKQQQHVATTTTTRGSKTYLIHRFFLQLNRHQFQFGVSVLEGGLNVCHPVDLLNLRDGARAHHFALGLVKV